MCIISDDVLVNVVFLFDINYKEVKMDSKYLITKDGLKKLKEDLKYRLTVVRNQIADKLEVATAQGDLSENAAYTSALEEQQMNEAKIVKK